MNEKSSPVWGVIAAMEEEMSLLKEASEIIESETIADMTFCRGKLNGAQVVLVVCGIGKVNAGICAQLLISRYRVDRIVNTGVAGSLDARINLGDLVVSTDAVQHDFDVSPIGFAKGEIPYTGLYAFPADETLRRVAVQAVKKAAGEVGVFEGRICSGDQFICSREQKEKILKNFGGLCCEMEGAAIAQTATLNHVPFVILRAISDKADDSEELSYAEFAQAAARRCASIVRTMIAED